MIITWTGLGWLFFLMPFIILIIEAIIFTIFGIDMRTYMAHYLVIGMILASILCWFLGKRVNKEKVVAYNDETGEPIIARNMHTIWSIPVQYFSIVIIVFVIVCFLCIQFL